MHRASSSPLTGVSTGYLRKLQEDYWRNPEATDASWQCLLQVLDEARLGIAADIPQADKRAADSEAIEREAAAVRLRGHLYANLDPLTVHSLPQALERLFSEHRSPTAAPVEELTRRYCGTLSLELGHMDDPALSAWLQDNFEALETDLPPEDLRALLDKLIEADEFERFLARKYPTKKRFGAEGAEALIPLLNRLVSSAVEAGVTDVVIGTMHRGRLNLMINVLGKSAVQLLAEIKGAHPFVNDAPRAADLPYHLGFDSSAPSGQHLRPLRTVLTPNPSHLEAVDPIVLGRARALQDLMGEGRAARVLPIILHTDAAVVGQGVVAETLQLSRTEGFGTGGAVHIIVNNQLGFTTEESEARTSTHCTGAWKAVDSAILHVNGDDPSAVCKAADLALAYRQTHGRDAVIDLVCYRRNGHNEIDEPTFTQPSIYRQIADHEPVAVAFSRQLISRGLVDANLCKATAAAYRERLEQAFDDAENFQSNATGYPGGRWTDICQGGLEANPDTGVDQDRLKILSAKLAVAPEGFSIHTKLERILRERSDGRDVSWSLAEALAFATLVTEGAPVRLTGQDVQRGAFSHRHLALVDRMTGLRHVAMNHLDPKQAPFQVFNSPLSEYAVLGFEYGYSLERPEALVVWEAQFGDFANGAQIIIDQYVTAAEEKWCIPSGLVMLLPHGLEGQGPEHSSARIERFLQLAAKDNIQIVNPSTPANYFHLLRRQVRGSRRKPLIVIAPKKLLRLPAAVSPLCDFGPQTRFQPVISSAEKSGVTRVLFCSGKIAYDLEYNRDARGARDVAIVRLEQLYPFPAEALTALIARWPRADYSWVQEEPENMGARRWLAPQIEQLLADGGARCRRLRYVGRSESPSPAGSFHGDHDRDQDALVQRAFDEAPN